MSEQNNNGKRTIIDKKTLLPISFVIALIGAVWFFATLSANVEANTGECLYQDIVDAVTN